MISNIKDLLNRYGQAAGKMAMIAGMAATTVLGPTVSLARGNEQHTHHSSPTHEAATPDVAQPNLVVLKDQLGENRSLKQPGGIIEELTKNIKKPDTGIDHS